MKLIKLALLFAITFILPATALDIIAPSSIGGTTHKFAMILQKDLQDKGFDTKIIIAGNCVLGKKEWQDSKSAIFITTEASNSVPECTVEITKENYNPKQNYYFVDYQLLENGDPEHIASKKKNNPSYPNGGSPRWIREPFQTEQDIQETLNFLFHPSR